MCLFSVAVSSLVYSQVETSAKKAEVLKEKNNAYTVTLKDWEKTKIGEYPIDVEDKEWKKLSIEEAVAACDMPEKYAKTLTTEELVDYAMNYPYLMDVLAFDELKDGIENLKGKSGLFKELYSRKDALSELVEEYKNIDVDYDAVAEGKASSTDYDSQMFIEEYVGVNYDTASKEDKKEFVDSYGDKYEEMREPLEDSSLTQVFYEGIEESCGEIPEEAVPESLEKDILSSDTSVGAAFTRISTGQCMVCGQNQDYGKITYRGKTVYVYKWISGGYSSSDITNLDNYIKDHYWTFVKLRSASGKYNCHSYAWYSTFASNIYWIGEPKPIYSNTSLYKKWRSGMRDIKAGDRVTFSNDDGLQHSGIINTEQYKMVTSKLGHFGVYQTTLGAMRGFYGANTVKYYIPVE